MKRLAFSIALALTPVLASAATADINTIRAYTLKALQKCPNPNLQLKPIQNGGPMGFMLYEATLISTDESCNRHVYVLYSPVTQQILIGTIIPLNGSQGAVESRISAVASQMLNADIRTEVSRLPLPDGLHAVTMTKLSKQGPFSYHGYVDLSGSFLIVAQRGNLQKDPGLSLREALNVDTKGVHRGNSKSKVEIIELSDFECPTCGKAHKKVEPIIAQNLSKIRYTRLDLPLFEHHEWSVNAALGAHAVQKVAPAKYWAYVNFIFENQEAIGKTDFDTVLRDFCSDNDINWKAVEKYYRSPEEKTAILEQVSRSFDVGINSTPTYIVNGQMMGFGPEGTFTIEAIKKAIAGK